MRIIEVTQRYRNDFHWIGQCEWCGHKRRYGDGYADSYYCMVIVPNRICDKCESTSLQPSCSQREVV